MSRFKLLYAEPGANHRYFSDTKAPGRIALADRSGDTPNETDDGTLYIDLDTPIEVTQSRFTTPSSYGAVTGNLAVVRPNGERLRASCNLHGIVFLKSQGAEVHLSTKIAETASLFSELTKE